MQEDFLHYIWKSKKLQSKKLIGSNNESVEIVSAGTHNLLSGPDFFNAKIRIDEQLWAGNVEIHVKASDWYVHGHEKDSNYNNVILHVVWKDDVSIFRTDNSQIPTLELKNYITPQLLNSYQDLFAKDGKSFINCEKEISKISPFIIKNWIDRLYFERLESKSNTILKLLDQSQNNWEQVLFSLLLRNFGSKINANSFSSIAQSLNFSVVQKTRENAIQLEAIFYGLAGFLDDDFKDAYYINLKKEYQFLKQKFVIVDMGVVKPDFFKLRPANFPTIRLSQMANLYATHQNIFSKIIEATSLEELYSIFEISASSYWDTHFIFGKESKISKKRLTKKFIDLLIINSVLPIKFYYTQYIGRAIDVEIVNIISKIKKEENSIIDNFSTLGLKASNALESQSIIQLYNDYCSKNKCLQCAIGNTLLKENS
tara:strand:- start:6803 stop:8083 length:1281 start_codon:yes stop_codon:yes gene_type:complete